MLACFFLALSTCLAQPPTRIFDVWMFGLGYGLDLRTSPPTWVNPALSPLRQLEGVAVMCDHVTGDLLLYSDGVTLYDQTHRPTPNGAGLLGHYSSAQSALFVPVPCSDSTYYLFTADQQGYMPNETPDGVRWNLVDRRANGGAGDIVGAKNRVLDPTGSERLCAIRHANGRDWWVLTTSRGGNEYRAWLVTAAGVASSPIVSRTGPAVYPIGSGGAAFELGILKASPDGRLVADSRYWSQDVVLARFDDATGIVSYAFAVDHSFASASTYGLSFSPDSRRLYYGADTRTGSLRWRTIRQATVQSPTGTLLDSTTVRTSSVEVGPTSPNSSGPYGDMQIGRDGKIYVVTSDIWLGVIPLPNAPAASCGYVECAYSVLGSPRIGIFVGLPNVITAWGRPDTSAILSGAFTICEGDSIQLTAKGIPPLVWYLDGAVLPDTGATITATRPGSYYVQEGGGGCSRHGLATLTVNPRPVVQITGDTVICEGTATVLDAGVHARYLWSTGDTVRAIAADAGVYSVTVTDGGCTSTASVSVVERLTDTLALAIPTTVCAGDTVDLAGPPSFLHYHWTRDGVATTDTQRAIRVTEPGVYAVFCESDTTCPVVAIGTLAVNAPRSIRITGDTVICEGSATDLFVVGQIPGDAIVWSDSSSGPSVRRTTGGVVRVTVTTPDGCSSDDSVHVTVNPLPSFHVPRFAYVCSDSDSVVVCIDTLPPGSVAGWSNGDLGQCATIVGPGVVRVRVIDSNGCDRVDSVYVLLSGYGTFSPNVEADTICEGGTVRATLPPGTTRGIWSSLDDARMLIGDTVDLPPGRWFVTAFAGSCPVSDTIEIAAAAPPVGTLLADLSICEGEARSVGTGSDSSTWTGPSAVSTGATRTFTIADTGTWIVRTPQMYGCERVDSVRLRASDNSVVRFFVVGGTFPPGEERNVVVRDSGDVFADQIDIAIVYDHQCVRVTGAPTVPPGWRAIVLTDTLGRYHVRIERDTATGPLDSDALVIPMTGYFSQVTMTPVALEVTAIPAGPCDVLVTVPGMIRLGGVCFFEERLIEVGDFAYDMRVIPNPAHGDAQIEVTTGLDGPITIEVFDMAGRILTSHETTQPAGRYGFGLSLATIASGKYYVRVRAGHVTMTRTLVVEQ